MIVDNSTILSPNSKLFTPFNGEWQDSMTFLSLQKCEKRCEELNNVQFLNSSNWKPLEITDEDIIEYMKINLQNLQFADLFNMYRYMKTTFVSDWKEDKNLSETDLYRDIPIPTYHRNLQGTKFSFQCPKCKHENKDFSMEDSDGWTDGDTGEIHCENCNSEIDWEIYILGRFRFYLNYSVPKNERKW